MEELAKEVHLPNLQKTIKRYNELCHKGHDDDFLKEPKFLFVVEKGPFYCLEQGDAAYCTMDGLKVDLDNVVLDKNGFPIKHLYAIGNYTRRRRLWAKYVRLLPLLWQECC